MRFFGVRSPPFSHTWGAVLVAVRVTRVVVAVAAVGAPAAALVVVVWWCWSRARASEPATRSGNVARGSPAKPKFVSLSRDLRDHSTHPRARTAPAKLQRHARRDSDDDDERASKRDSRRSANARS